MSLKILVNNVRIPIIGIEWAGSKVDPVNDAKRYGEIVAAGGVFLPATNPTVAAAALLAAKVRERAGDPEEAQSIMVGASIASAAAGLPVALVLAISFADYAALATGVKSFDYNLGAALPAGALLASPPILSPWVGFDDATHAAVTAAIGTTVGGHDVGGTALDVDVTNATGFPGVYAGSGAAYVGFPLSTQLHLRVASTVDLKTLTAGSMTFTVTYYVPQATT